MSGLEVLSREHEPAAAAAGEEKEKKKQLIYPWLPDSTPLALLTLATEDNGSRKLDARNYAVKSPNAATSRLSGKCGTTRMVFVLPPISEDRLQAGSVVVSRPIALLLSQQQQQQQELKTLPVLITSAAITRVHTSGTADMLVRACLVEQASKRPIPLGGHTDLLQHTSLEHDTKPEFGPLLLLSSRSAAAAEEPQVLVSVVDDVCTTQTQRPHAAFVQRLASLNYKELETEMERSVYEMDTADGKSKTDFLRIKLPVERGAQPANSLQWFLFSFWYTLASETAAEIHKVPALKDQWFQKEPPSVLVHRESMRRVIQAALVRAGRSGPVIDAKEGIALALHGIERRAGTSGTASVTVFVDVEYALFASPESIHLEGGVPVPALSSSNKGSESDAAGSSSSIAFAAGRPETVKRFGRVIGGGGVSRS